MTTALRLRGWLAATVLSACSALSANAEQTEQAAPASGFYLRGEIGGGFGQSVTFRDTAVNPSPIGQGCSLCSSRLPASTGNSVVFGAGVGYRLTRMFRADLSLDYVPSLEASGTAIGSKGNVKGPASAGVDSLVGLANGYLDLAGAFPGTFGPFEPYLTAGFGLARNELDTMSGTVVGIPFSLTGAARTDFAWAAGAGVGYSLAPRTTVDLAYKFFDLGELRTGTTLTAAGFIPQVTPSKSGALGVHAVMVDLRYAL